MFVQRYTGHMDGHVDSCSPLAVLAPRWDWHVLVTAGPAVVMREDRTDCEEHPWQRQQNKLSHSCL